MLNDSSGLYADLSGEASAVAAGMAVEEFGGELLWRAAGGKVLGHVG